MGRCLFASLSILTTSEGLDRALPMGWEHKAYDNQTRLHLLVATNGM